MSVLFIPTVGRKPNNPHAQQVVNLVRTGDVYGDGDQIVLYAGWPKVKDYDGRTHSADVTVLSGTHGVKLVKASSATTVAELRRDAKSIAQAAASTESLLGKSLKLKRKRKLIFEVVPIIYAPQAADVDLDDDEVELAHGEGELIQLLQSETGTLDEEQRAEVQAIIEGAKALGQLADLDPDADVPPVARAFRDLEAVIYNFDATQRSVALTDIRGPQRIRGLAGTGKTVILAMKAALAHIENPDAKILITYYTRSLRDIMERLITRFHRHFAEIDPNWENLHIRHGWGRRNTPGVYRDAAFRHNLSPRSFGDVRGAANPFDAVCRELVDSKVLTPFYDMILVDEGQDFPDSFYQMCFFLTKGDRDEKQIIWAYDELQNVFDVTVREPDQLFGEDDDGQPRISLTRSLPDGTDTNDFVLQKAYRNQREVLVLAHAMGFGVYRETVQMLENATHWEDVGYDVVSGNFQAGSKCVVERPLRNSPSTLDTPQDVKLIDIHGAEDIDAEVEAASAEIRSFIAKGLKPDEIMVVSLDDRAARGYFSRLMKLLAASKIVCNNIINDPYSEPAFRIEGKVTLSTLYRAKGNEAAVVIILGADAANLATRKGRNKLFVAFTRTKGWLRIFGYGNETFQNIAAEVKTALDKSPRIEFVMPDLNHLNTIQRGLEEKHARIIEAKRRFERMKNELNLSDEDLISLMNGDNA